MSECAHHSSCPWLQYLEDGESARSARSFESLPEMSMSPRCVVSSIAVEPSRPGPTTAARFYAAACRQKPQSVAELAISQDQAALGEIRALAGVGGANTQATASAVTRNNCIRPPRVT